MIPFHAYERVAAVMRPLALAVACGIAVPAAAQDKSADDDYLDSLKTCQSVVDDNARLACYDGAVGRVVLASEESGLRIVDAAEITKTKRGLFGFSLPRIALFDGSDGEEAQIDLLQSTITDVAVRGRNTLYLTIADGNAVWRINSASRRALQAEVGDSVEFKKASLGSYFIRIDGRTGEKGIRVQ